VKHRVNSLRELNLICLLDTTGVNPEVFQVIFSSLLFAESDLLVARLVCASAVHNVFKGNLLILRAPCVGKYRIWRNVIVSKAVKPELTSVTALEKTHCVQSGLDASGKIKIWLRLVMASIRKERRRNGKNGERQLYSPIEPSSRFVSSIIAFNLSNTLKVNHFSDVGD
jgi:hypothetical protein